MKLMLPILILLFIQCKELSRSFKASVVEFEPFPASLEDLQRSPFEYVSRNVALMEKFILQAKAEKSNIIVFPEYALNHMKASDLSPEDGLKMAQILPRTGSPSLCTQRSLPTYQQILQIISCYAINYRVLIIANLITTENKGGEKGMVFHNTNVAFDRQGRIIARYRKFHLYNEPLISPPDEPDVSFFDTDFGVRIGMVTCFDILFQEPLRSLKRSGVNVIAFPTLWFNELPFLTGLGFHSGVARREEMDILSACYYYLEGGVTGSGIYSFDEGIKVSTWNEEPKTLSGALSIPKNTTSVSSKYTRDTQHKPPHFFHEDLFTYEFERVNLGEEFLQINRKGVHCSIKYSVVNGSGTLPSQGYMLIGKKGVRTCGGQYKIGIQVCGLVFCPDLGDRSSCGAYRAGLHGNIEFKELKLKGLFVKGVKPTPVSLSFNFHPIQGTKYILNKQNEYLHVLEKSTKDVFSLGLYGRIYSLDSTNG